MNFAKMLATDVKPLGYWPTQEQSKKAKRPPREKSDKSPVEVMWAMRIAKSDAIVKNALDGKDMSRVKIAEAAGRSYKSLVNIITRQIKEGKLTCVGKEYCPGNQRMLDVFRWTGD